MRIGSSKKLLNRNRKNSFEAIAAHLGLGYLCRVAENLDQERYPGQKLFFNFVDDCNYIVPYEERGKIICPTTIISNRNATRDFLKQLSEEEKR